MRRLSETKIFGDPRGGAFSEEIKKGESITNGSCLFSAGQEKIAQNEFFPCHYVSFPSFPQTHAIASTNRAAKVCDLLLHVSLFRKNIVPSIIELRQSNGKADDSGFRSSERRIRVSP